ncbi:MAG TPA: tetratricopeptide repeat protein [Vulgatibacter sp.]|nr:tetratricopeptide repeat protein [Vulgatibacter sp.]
MIKHSIVPVLLLVLVTPAAAAAAAPATAAREGVPSLLDWGRYLRSEDEPDVAEVGFDAAIERSPTWPLPYLERAELAIARREGVAEARADLERLAAANARNPRLHRLIGELAELSGDDDAAARSLSRSLDLLPERPQVRARYAAVLARLSRHDQAAAEYARVVEELPDDHGLRSRYADALEGAGRYKEARKQLDLLVKRQPGKEAPLRQLARFLERRGDRRGAAAMNAKADAAAGKQRNLRPLPPSRS